MTIDLRVLYEVVGGLFLIYTFARTLRGNSRSDIESALKGSDAFGHWLESKIEAAFTRALAATAATLKSDATQIAHAVFDARFLALMQQGAFVTPAEREALMKRIDDLAAAVNNLSAVVAKLEAE